jgi:hypothetical protein
MSDEQAAARTAEETSINGDRPKPREVPWLKGHLRDDNSASKCVALHVQMPPVPISQREVEVPGGILTPGNAPKAVELIMMGVPTMVLACHHPHFIAFARSRMPAPLHPQIGSVLTSLEICRMCPFHQRPQ